MSTWAWSCGTPVRTSTIGPHDKGPVGTGAGEACEMLVVAVDVRVIEEDGLPDDIVVVANEELDLLIDETFVVVLDASEEMEPFVDVIAVNVELWEDAKATDDDPPVEAAVGEADPASNAPQTLP